MNKKRQREISYLGLSKQGAVYSIRAQPVHAVSLAKHFLNRDVPFVKRAHGVDSQEALVFPAVEDGAELEKLLREWKERFVSGGEQYL